MQKNPLQHALEGIIFECLFLISSSGFGQYAHCRTVTTTLLEAYNAIGQCIQSVIFTLCYILACIVTISTLANDNVTSDTLLTTENLNT